MNKICDKTFCIYHKTCLMKEKEKIDKCTGILSDKNPHSENYVMAIRGESK